MAKNPWLVCLLAALAGCSSIGGRQESGEVTLSWYCRKLDDGGQYCERRNLRNGQPVDGVVLDRLTIPKEQPAPAPAAEVAAKKPGPAAGEAIPWDRNTLNAVNAVEDRSNLDVENLGPALRQPRQTIDMWEKHRRAQSARAGKSAKAEQSSGTARTDDSDDVPGGSRSLGAASTTSDNAAGQKLYTIQLAAFSSSEQSHAFIVGKQYAGMALQEKRIVTKGQPWWIVIYGSYPSYREAEVAARELALRYPHIKLWTRSMTLLNKLAEG